AVADEVAERTKLDSTATWVGIGGGRRLRVGQVEDQDTVKPVMADPVVNHGVVLASGQIDACSHTCVACETELRHVGIIVVMDRVLADHRAGRGSSWTRLTSRAGTVLRRGPVVVVEAIGEDTNLVLVPFAVLDDEM